MRVNRAGLWLALALILVLALSICGCDNPDEKDHVNSSTVDVDVNVAVQVADLINNTPVDGIPVYFMSCSPNGTSDRDIRMTNQTEDGWALFFTSYRLDTDQTIYLGATDREPLLISDFNNRKFNGTGYLGEWKSFNYSVLYNNVDNRATISCTIAVDLDRGRMI